MSRSTARRVLALEAEALRRLSRRVDASFDRAVRTFLSTRGRVVVTGMGKSGLIGAKVAATLSSTGTPAFALDPAQALHGDMGAVTAKDAVLAITRSGETEELKVLLPLLKKAGCPIVLLTGDPASSLSSFCDVVLDAGVEKEACPHDLAPTTSTTAALAMGDALAVALLERRRFTAKDFARFHPAGSLGERLRERVSDVMRKGRAVPIVKAGDSFRKTAGVITRKRVGCALLTDGRGRLKGIVVDGDLRRALLKDPDTRRWNAGRLSNSHPRTIDPQATLAKALQAMEENAVYQLAVADKRGRPVGLLHLHDLLGRGRVRIN